ncbi:hypothetical protein H4219_006090 [Mycoemilia scoparia]|uniref:Uncharacterized protein n=1 Tax=Mycoemilia scoparia TaxID=417184 RepID=A0A9W8DJP3_9FUNG|nr:hypothetical protein H4219_006090 [Mycoemilia scoparia]
MKLSTTITGLSIFAVLALTSYSYDDGNDYDMDPVCPWKEPSECHDCVDPVCTKPYDKDCESDHPSSDDPCNPCGQCTCPEDYYCDNNQVFCITEPCYPVATCRPIIYYN